ncbi:MAG: nucleotidyltransferase family protein [Hydrogenobaculum sp.]
MWYNLLVGSVDKVLNKDDVILILRSNMKQIKKFGVKRIGMFGSAARNELREGSDIDIVVEFEKGRGGFRDFGGLVEFLERLLGRKVDILTPSGIESIKIKSVKERIKKELKYV